MKPALEGVDINTESAVRQVGAGGEQLTSLFQSVRETSVSGVTGAVTRDTRANRLTAAGMQASDRWVESDTGWEYLYDGVGWAWVLGVYTGTDAQRGALSLSAADNGALFLTTDTTPRKLYEVQAAAWVLLGVLLNAQADAVTDYTDNVAGAVASVLAAIPDPTDAPVDADALRDDLAANVLPKIRAAISSIASKENATRSELRQAGVIP